MEMRFCEPIKLDEWFEVDPDEQPWEAADNPTDAYRPAYTKHRTPTRQRATFENIDGSLKPKHKYARQIAAMNKRPGVYIMAAKKHEPAIYVGIACDPYENILRRMRKHRIKLTGSHVGGVRRPPNEHEINDGDVNHTSKWRQFAPRRYLHFKGMPDKCEDVVFSFAPLPENPLPTIRHFAESVEHCLVNSSFQRVCEFMLGEKDAFLLTASTNQRAVGDVRIFLGEKEIDCRQAGRLP